MVNIPDCLQICRRHKFRVQERQQTPLPVPPHPNDLSVFNTFYIYFLRTNLELSVAPFLNPFFLVYAPFFLDQLNVCYAFYTLHQGNFRLVYTEQSPERTQRNLGKEVKNKKILPLNSSLVLLTSQPNRLFKNYSLIF